MTLFVSHVVRSCEVSEDIACGPAFVMFFCPTACLPRLVWPFTLNEKFDCDITFAPKINIVLSVISVMKKTILLQMI